MSDAVNRRDRWIPWYFVAFFVGIALVNAVMVTLAVRTRPGVVSEHPYEEGLDYDKTIAAADAQTALGLEGGIAFHEAGSRQQGTMIFSLRDKADKAVTATPVTLSIRRPTLAGYDQSFVMAPSGEGVYSANIGFPLPGQWEVRVYAQTPRGSYQQAKRLIVP